MENYLIWIPVLPFIGFLLNGLLGRRLGPRGVAWVGCLAPLGAFAIAYAAFREVRTTAASFEQHLFDWIVVGDAFQANFGLLFDPLSAVMCLVITGVGSLIHVYSIGYMRGDEGFARYFSYLNLFTAFMLILVLGDNLLLLFVGWEGVGLCSYLLIGFWYKDVANCDAGRKAFVVNRIGDFGFLIAMFLIFIAFGTLDTRSLQNTTVLETAAPGMLTAITLLLFLGATGKSAQIPLYTWLPDAMAGPTPVSALIHAATMVTSGIYMCCRLWPLFDLAPHTSEIIAGIGAATALFAALIALSQNDIKKVLAYSTVSQLGYMFFAVGLKAYGAAMFHLVTHAFFKALLFLGAGAVIHAMHHEQDMRRMGGLRHLLPFTHLVFFVGAIAIAGVPLLSGFVSKDEILYFGFKHASDGLGPGLFWLMAYLTAGLTAFYMFRCLSLTFWGQSRVEEKLRPHVREPEIAMLAPLFVLAVLTVFGGKLGLPPFWPAHPNYVGEFLGFHAEHDHGLALTSMILAVGMAALGIGLAVYLYGPGRDFLAGLVDRNALGRRLRSLSENKFYVDEIYQALFVAPFEFLAVLLWFIVDRGLIDAALVNGSAALTRTVAEWFRRMQSGFVPAYLLTFSFGVLALLVILMNLLKSTGN